MNEYFILIVKPEEAITSQQSLSQFLKEKEEAEMRSQLGLYLIYLYLVGSFDVRTQDCQSIELGFK